MNYPKGILTLAQGKQRYINMAIRLAQSIRLNAPGLPLAVISDRTESEMKQWFDVVIPVNSDYGLGLIQKLYLFNYSPFDETIFIDADCLVVRDFSFLWAMFEKHDVSVIGEKLVGGSWAGMNVDEVLNLFKINYIIKLNGGVYYFKKNRQAEEVFIKAQSLIKDYDKIGIDRLRGQINEEPLMSLAMSTFGETPINDENKGMRTPVGQEGSFKMDLLLGVCSFYKHKILVQPAIMHFGGGYPEAFHYRREVKKLDLYKKLHLPRKVASFIVNSIYNPIYIIYVFFYRVGKFIFKGTKMKLKPLMPMFRFE